MSEIINNSGDRNAVLTDFSRRLISGEDGRMLIEKYKQIINTVTPAETMQITSAPPLKPHNPLIFKRFFSVCHRIRQNLPQTFSSPVEFKNDQNHLKKYFDIILISIT